MIEEELNKFNQWRVDREGESLELEIKEYVSSLTKPKKTLYDLLFFTAVLHMVSVNEMLTKSPKNSKSRGGSNNVSRARGWLVKAVIEKKIVGLNTRNVYQKLFGIPFHHSTAQHFMVMGFVGEELKLYNKIINYIETYDIDWTSSEPSNH